jgi:hypothetical protein
MSDTSQPKGFVIKASNSTGLEMWVSPPRFGDHRTFGPRARADVFKTRGEADAAIGKLPVSFEHAGFAFAVDAVE